MKNPDCNRGRKSDDDTAAVVDLMLNDFCNPAFERVTLLFPVDVEIFYFDLFIACAGSCASTTVSLLRI